MYWFINVTIMRMIKEEEPLSLLAFFLSLNHRSPPENEDIVVPSFLLVLIVVVFLILVYFFLFLFFSCFFPPHNTTTNTMKMASHSIFTPNQNIYGVSAALYPMIPPKSCCLAFLGRHFPVGAGVRGS